MEYGLGRLDALHCRVCNLVLILVLMDMGFRPVIMQLVIAQRVRHFWGKKITYPNNKKCIFMLQKYDKKRKIANICR